MGTVLGRQSFTTQGLYHCDCSLEQPPFSMLQASSGDSMKTVCQSSSTYSAPVTPFSSNPSRLLKTKSVGILSSRPNIRSAIVNPVLVDGGTK
ncbi:hypothetical protein AOLI_G00195160 [Acnodon oligacanthus]